MENSKFKLVVNIDEGGAVDISSEGVCHHIYLLGVLESIKHDILNAAVDMSSAFSVDTEKTGEEDES